MKRLKHAPALLIALAAALCLCACSAAPEKALAEAQEKLSAVGSLSCGFEVDIGVTLAGESITAKSSCLAECTSEPAAVKLQVSTDADTLGTSQYTAYAMSAGGLYSAYIQHGGVWVRQDLSGPEALERYDIRLASALWLEGVTGVSDAGSQELDGITARRYDCVVSPTAVDGVMSSSGAWEALSVLGLGQSEAQELLSGLGEIPMSVWIGPQGLPLRYELDLGGVMSALLEKLSGSLGGEGALVTIDSFTVIASPDNFDAVPPIEVPSEALGARPLSGEELF